MFRYGVQSVMDWRVPLREACGGHVLQWLAEQNLIDCGSVFSTENLFKLGYPNAKKITRSCAGVLVIQVAGEVTSTLSNTLAGGDDGLSLRSGSATPNSVTTMPPIYVVWCQMEIRHEIQWAGAKDAERDVMSDGSKQLVMGPRNSFDVFVELSADSCDAWKPNHVCPVHPNPG